MKVGFLLVTCCLEPSRTEVLSKVVANLREQASELLEQLVVFDNASTQLGTKELLTSTFSNVYQSDKNVGYWSAIDWWLEQLTTGAPDYTYIIESDMIHYDFDKFWDCISFLDRNAHVGSVRLHEYSIKNKHLFNKDQPRKDSKRNLWQSHTNRETGKLVELSQAEDNIWTTTFLTQLPAINRYATMKDVFSELRLLPNFSEHDFQRGYWRRYQSTAILDGGIFHCDLNPHNVKSITGSWTSVDELKRLGYHPTRFANIIPKDRYNVTKLQ
jgi:hypothetical protein